MSRAYPWLAPWRMADLYPDELEAIRNDIDELNRAARG